jgi:transposase
MRPSGTARELEQRRLLAMRLLSQGLSVSEVAQRVRVDSRSVRRWRAATRAAGETAVAAKPARGRPRRLTPGDLARLRWMILVDAGRPLGVRLGTWSCTEVADLIERQFGIHYHRSHVNRILHRLGIMPRKRYR